MQHLDKKMLNFVWYSNPFYQTDEYEKTDPPYKHTPVNCYPWIRRES